MLFRSTAAYELVVARYDATAWNSFSATPINPATAITGTAVSSTLTSFGTFTFGLKPTSVVPVKLISFNGKLLNGMADLSWTTAQESEMIGYEVQESSDATHFNTIGFVEAKNLMAVSSYHFSGTRIIANKSYFRILMMNRDGKSDFSQIICLTNPRTPIVSILQNPVAGQNLTFSFSGYPAGKIGRAHV